jgi:hypothetical protein
LLLDIIVAPSMKFTELDRRASKNNVLNRTALIATGCHHYWKLQKQRAPQLQIALYSRPKAVGWDEESSQQVGANLAA